MELTQNDIINFLTESVTSCYNESYSIAKVFQEAYDNNDKIIFEEAEKDNVINLILPMKDRINYILEHSNLDSFKDLSFEGFKFLESTMPNTFYALLEGKGDGDKQEYDKLMKDIKDKTEEVRKSKNTNDCLRLASWITLACSSATVWIPVVNILSYLGILAAAILAVITMSNDHNTRIKMRKNLDKLEDALDKIKDRDSYDRANEKIKKLRQELQKDEGLGKYDA